MRARCMVAAGLLAWTSATAAADLAGRRFDDSGWRRTARLAAMPICDVFRAGRVSDDEYRRYQERQRDILLAREAMNDRYGQKSPFLSQLMPGDFVRGCRQAAP